MYQTNYRTLNKSKILAAVAVIILIVAFIVMGALVSLSNDLSVPAYADPPSPPAYTVLQDLTITIGNPTNVERDGKQSLSWRGAEGYYPSGEFTVSHYYYDGIWEVLLPNVPNYDASSFVMRCIQGVSGFVEYDSTYRVDTLYKLETKLPSKYITLCSFYTEVNEVGTTVVHASNFIYYKKPVDLPETPVREGHTFNGWYYDDALTVPYINGDTIYFDTQLYPKFTINSYAVSYYIDGVRVFNESLVYGTDLTAPAVTGYHFAGWYRDAAFTLSHNGIVTSDITLYAKYTPVPHSVIVYGYDGIILAQETRGYNSTYNLAALTVPNVVGYTFDGWYRDSEFSIPASSSLLVVTDVFFYAKYTINLYRVIIFGVDGEMILNEEMEYGTEVDTSEPPEIEGYTFDGYFEDQGYTIPFVNTAVTSNLAVFAKFLPVILDYRIYGFNGVQLRSGLIQYGLDIDPDYMVAPEVANRTFLGWFSDPEFETEYVTGTAVKADTDIYAKYSSISYTLSAYSPEGEILSMTFPDSLAVSSEILTAPELEGLSFIGWYTDSLFQHPFAIGSMIVSDTSLYAKYTGVSYVVPVYGFNNAEVDSITVAHGALIDITVIEVPEVPGFTFFDFYTDPQFLTVFDPGVGISYSASLYLKYTRDVYTVRAFAGIDAEAPFFTREYNSYAQLYERSLNLAPKTGYTFLGWYSDIELTQAMVFPKILSQSMDLYPKWQINTYTYNIYGYNSELLQTGSLNHGGVISSAYFVAPVVEGYIFDGWYRDSTLTVAYTNTALAAPVNVYAKYTLKTFAVTVYGFNDVVNYTGMVAYGETVPAAALQVNPVTGYTFKGYFCNSPSQTTAAYAIYTAGKGIYGDLNVYLRYDRNVYHYEIFGFADDVSLTSGDMNYGDRIPEPTAPELEGYAFVDWYSDPGFVSVFDFDTVISNDMTIYAKYSADIYTYSFVDALSGETRTSGTFIYGNTVPAPSANVHTGYTFSGWYIVGTDDLYVSSVKYPYNLAVEARYSRVQYQCNIYTELLYSDTIMVSHGDILTAPEVPEIDDYVFDGFYADQAYTVPYDFSQPITGNVAIYAKYTEKEGVNFSPNTWGLIGGSVALIGLLGAGYYVFTKFSKGKKRKPF